MPKRKDIKKILYPADCSPSKFLFNLLKAKSLDYTWLVEGSMDAMYLSQIGINVVSSFGAHLSYRQADLISRHFKKL